MDIDYSTAALEIEFVSLVNGLIRLQQFVLSAWQCFASEYLPYQKGTKPIKRNEICHAGFVRFLNAGFKRGK